MPRIKQTTVFQFDELDDSAKDRARQWYRDGGFDYEWWDCTFEDAKECLKLAGFTIKDIYFSGFSSQGDGACFVGSWSARDVQPGKLKEYAPQDTELHRIAEEMENIARQSPFSSMSVKQRGHYSHEMCTEFTVSVTDDQDNEIDSPEIEELIIETSRDAMRWIYRTLEKEYDYLSSDAQVDETIRINEYEFTAEGKRT